VNTGSLVEWERLVFVVVVGKRTTNLLEGWRWEQLYLYKKFHFLPMQILLDGGGGGDDVVVEVQNMVKTCYMVPLYHLSILALQFSQPQHTHHLVLPLAKIHCQVA